MKIPKSIHLEFILKPHGSKSHQEAQLAHYTDADGLLFASDGVAAIVLAPEGGRGNETGSVPREALVDGAEAIAGDKNAETWDLEITEREYMYRGTGGHVVGTTYPNASLSVVGSVLSIARKKAVFSSCFNAKRLANLAKALGSELIEVEFVEVENAHAIVVTPADSRPEHETIRAAVLMGAKSNRERKAEASEEGEEVSDDSQTSLFGELEPQDAPAVAAAEVEPEPAKPKAKKVSVKKAKPKAKKKK